MMDNKGLIVNIFNLDIGLETYEDVSYIRIKSKEYNLLVMLDYAPMIGEIKGNVEINTPKGNLILENIKASFINNNNVFNLIIDGEYKGEAN